MFDHVSSVVSWRGEGLGKIQFLWYGRTCLPVIPLLMHSLHMDFGGVLWRKAWREGVVFFQLDTFKICLLVVLTLPILAFSMWNFGYSQIYKDYIIFRKENENKNSQLQRCVLSCTFLVSMERTCVLVDQIFCARTWIAVEAVVLPVGVIVLYFCISQ